MSSPTSLKTFLRAEVRVLDAQLDAGGTLELGLAAATIRLAHMHLQGHHAAWLLEESLTEPLPALASSFQTQNMVHTRGQP